MQKKDLRYLDTHLGSGSIALACHNRGFDLVACELDTEYYNRALERLKTHQQQLTIF
jgi:site-specific DNA-methyltransferase (adenine-specific)